MRHLLLGLLLLLGSGLAFGQRKFSSMTPMITLLDTKTKALEKKDRYVVKSLLDILQRDMSDARNSTTHFFSKSELSNIIVLGDPEKISALQLRLYQLKNDTWSFVRTYSGNSEINTAFSAPESAFYKLEVMATFRAGQSYTHFGLLIDQEQ
ncbi:hypothetical protein [Runella zeae]|uniref:hypothetical protein n=1 Tax=Runella zeae TaxID=94255 RepID=UPI00235399D5|nr:hypothetical protein [Runella zeae]